MSGMVSPESIHCAVPMCRNWMGQMLGLQTTSMSLLELAPVAS
jgi:hypothetical protein